MTENMRKMGNGMRVWRWISITLLIIVLGWIIWRVHVNSDPMAGIPMPPPAPQMPSPNAFDYYQGAWDAMYGTGQLYTNNKAADAMDHPNKYGNYTLSEKQAVLTAGAKGLGLLHQGFAYRCQAPTIRSFSQLCPYYAHDREMARFLRFTGRVKAEQGDWAGAMDAALDSLRLGSDSQQHATLTGTLVGWALESIERQDCWVIPKHLTGAQAHAAGLRLKQIIANEPSLSDIISEEKYATQMGLLDIFNKPNWRKEFTQLMSDNTLQNKLMMLTLSKRRIMLGYTRYMDTCISNTQHAWIPGNVPDSHDQIVKILVIPYDRVREKYLVNRTQNALLLVTLALRAYYADHGNYPATLSLLAPSYLKKLPDDPFTASSTLQYRLQGNKYLLYSIGPDGIDNGGTPIRNSASQGIAPNQVFHDEGQYNTGDIVAGTNIN